MPAASEVTGFRSTRPPWLLLAGASVSAAASSIGEVGSRRDGGGARGNHDGGGRARGRKLDDDKLNLLQTTLEEQKVDAAIAEKKLEQDRAQLVIVQPGALPDKVDGVNIALYSAAEHQSGGQPDHSRTERQLRDRLGLLALQNPDDAQRAFRRGGPETDKWARSRWRRFACGIRRRIARSSP